MPDSISKVRVLSLYKRLYKHYGPQHWWPAGTAWEMMVGAILTQNTSWTNVEKAMANLRTEGAHGDGAPFPSVKAIAAVPRRRLQTLIRSSGYFRQKADRLQRFARALLNDPDLFKSRDRLLAQHGIGPETADAILLYAAHEPVFVVDAYTRRIGQRMGLFKTDEYHEVQDFFQGHLPADHRLYNEFHALIVRLAKEVCTSRHPKCGICPVREICKFGMRGRNLK